MSVLRERLKQGDPNLFAALEGSWKIALEEWLSALAPNMGSYNSYPHLRNVEAYLDQIILGLDQSPFARHHHGLTPGELYVLLASVLFHDIGRSQKGPGHAVASQEQIEKQFAHLGIPSREIARVIGRIALYHGGQPAEGADELPDVVVDRFGEIRQLSLAAVLRLADQMDSAHTRVLPEYLRPRDDLEIIGRFRSLILGVQIDHASQLVRTVLSDEFATGSEALKEINKLLSGEPDETPPDSAAAGSKELFAPSAAPPPQECASPPAAESDHVAFPAPERLTDRVFALLAENLRKSREKKPLPASGRGADGSFTKARLFDDKWKKLAQDEALVSETDTVYPWTLVGVILGDVCENRKVLQTVRDSLASIGIPLAAWLVEFREHLFNGERKETFEPVFHQEYLKHVVDGMWQLSTRIFGTSLFAYEDLTSYVGEPNVDKLKRAVRRISIVSEGMTDFGNKSIRSPIWTGASHWRWESNLSGETQRESCKFTHRDDLCNRIDELGEPHA